LVQTPLVIDGPPFTANRLVAYNLRALRQGRGLTQEQAAAMISPYLGEQWSKAVFSAAERSADVDRVRQFTADDLAAFSLAFDVPVTYFLLPPRPRDRNDRLFTYGHGETVDWRTYVLDVVLGARTWRESVVARLRDDVELAVYPELAATMDRLVAVELAQRGYADLPELAEQVHRFGDLITEVHSAAGSAPLQETFERHFATQAEAPTDGEVRP
jgi:transcriptional regulator with XRE-family HTH domain